YPVSGFTAVGINKSIFIFGGEQGWAVSGEVYEYRLDKDRWYRRANMPVPRYAAAASVLKNNHIHIMGGNSLLGGYLFNLDHDIFIP
ncbi:hypothetical protein HY041_03990, partial [Candidatus Roizmanbacteria bacterium]|nr:hypothetical protein [Candidatus Roizmanbacteria bacterium]